LSGDYDDDAALPTTAAQCPRLGSVANLTQIVPLAPKADGTPRTQIVLYADMDFGTSAIPG
jgi:hypothetical protein